MERRLAAILAADMVGFTRLMAANEVGTLSRLKSLRKKVVEPSIGRHKGRVVKVTGDGFLAEFASIVEAVGCAVEINDAMAAWNGESVVEQQIQLRMGVHIGDVIIEDGDIYGDGVNLACRLEQIAAPGGICLSAIAYDSIGPDLRALFEDRGDQHLKNIDRPIHVWQAKHGATAPQGMDTHDTPTVAVLPFANLSSNTELDFLAEGLVEDIITLLARIPGFLVIARNSTMALKSGGVDIREIGRELGARYVVEGSVRPVEDSIRVTVQLIDSSNSSHLWAEQFDVQAERMASLQDEVTTRIVASLQPELTVAESLFVERSRRAVLDAWALHRKGSAIIYRHGWNEASFRKAAEYYRKAIEIDPEFATAHAHLSLNLAIGHLLGFVEDKEEAHKEAETALRIAGNDSEVLGFAGCALFDLGHDRGIDLLEQAVELNPSNAQAVGALGAAYFTKGNFPKAEEIISHAIRISPRDPRMALWGAILAAAIAAQGDLERAIGEARSACRRDRKLHHPRFVLAALLVKIGKIDEAKAALREGMRLNPNIRQKEVARFSGDQTAEILELMESIR